MQGGRSQRGIRRHRLSIWPTGLAVACLVCLPASVATHDEYRFVGTVVRYDGEKDRLEMRARERDEDGAIKEVTVRMSVPGEAKVLRSLKEVDRSELKPGTFVVVDAVGVDMVEIDAVTIEIVEPPRPAPRVP
jgi:hypothetical protein